MKRDTLQSVILSACIAVASMAGTALTTSSAAAQTRSLPIFEVDPAWPKVPAKWKLGDASSIAIDAQDNVWVLHRPRTLKLHRADGAGPAEAGVQGDDRAGQVAAAYPA